MPGKGKMTHSQRRAAARINKALEAQLKAVQDNELSTGEYRYTKLRVFKNKDTGLWEVEVQWANTIEPLLSFQHLEIQDLRKFIPKFNKLRDDQIEDAFQKMIDENEKIFEERRKTKELVEKLTEGLSEKIQKNNE